MKVRALMSIAGITACLAFLPVQARRNDATQSVYGNLTYHVKTGRLSQKGGKSYSSQRCSNEEFFCLKSEKFDIALPRRCSIQTLSTGWTYEGISMALVEESKPITDPHLGYGRLFAYRPNTKPQTLIFVWASLTASNQIERAHISQIGGLSSGTVAVLDDVRKFPNAWGPLIEGPPLAVCSAPDS